MVTVGPNKEQAGVCPPWPFPDVTASNTFCRAISWMKAQQVTYGYPDGDFHPLAPVTRRSMAAFFFRLTNLGQAQPNCSTAPYPDVPKDYEFCGYIAWFKGQEITKPANGKYQPLNSVTRGAMAAFIFRLSFPGTAQPSCSTPYPDVTAANEFCGYISWMKNQHITYGYPDGNFHPNAPVSREAMAAFLNRLAS
jgi:hypothetical protein